MKKIIPVMPVTQTKEINPGYLDHGLTIDCAVPQIGNKVKFAQSSRTKDAPSAIVPASVGLRRRRWLSNVNMEKTIIKSANRINVIHKGILNTKA